MSRLQLAASASFILVAIGACSDDDSSGVGTGNAADSGGSGGTGMIFADGGLTGTHQPSLGQGTSVTMTARQRSSGAKVTPPTF